MVKNMDAYRILAGKLQGRDHVAEMHLDGWRTLGCILETQNVTVSTGSTWLRTGIFGRLLFTSD